jgi:hypothetical protein
MRITPERIGAFVRPEGYGPGTSEQAMRKSPNFKNDSEKAG